MVVQDVLLQNCIRLCARVHLVEQVLPRTRIASEAGRREPWVLAREVILELPRHVAAHIVCIDARHKLTPSCDVERGIGAATTTTVALTSARDTTHRFAAHIETDESKPRVFFRPRSKARDAELNGRCRGGFISTQQAKCVVVEVAVP